MRLFIVSRIRLADLARAPRAPAAGDAVAYFREAQDPDGRGGAALTAAGVAVSWAEAEIRPDEAPAVERAAADACFGWYGDDDGDPTMVDGLSTGRALAARFYVDFNLYYLLRAGVVIDRLLRRQPAAETVVSDLRDGSFIYCDHPEWPESMAWRSALELLAARAGRTVLDLPVTAGVPGVFRKPEIPRPAAAWAAALRGLFARPFRQTDRAGPPWVFVSALHGVARVGEALARSGRVRTAADRPGVAGATFIDPQGVWAPPDAALRRVGRRCADRLAALPAAWARESPFRYDGVDLGPVAAQAAQRLRREQLPVLTLRAAQFRRLSTRLRPAAVVMSADYHVQTMAAAAWAAPAGTGQKRAYFVEHSVMTQPCSFYSGSHADTGLIYLVESAAHLPAYGFDLPEDAKPPARRLAACAPLPEMVAVRGLRPDPPVRRALCVGYNSYSPHAVDRTPFYDRYLIALAAAARALRGDGIALCYRPHPAERPEYAAGLLADLGATDLIALDRTPSFRETLPAFDAVISNAGTCYYQALFAGWPTIFFEPSGMPERWIGLAAEPESGRPMARSAAELTDLVRDVYVPDSPTARFADFYRRPEAERYFGRSPEHADQIIADAVLNDLFPPRPNGSFPAGDG